MSQRWLCCSIFFRILNLLLSSWCCGYAVYEQITCVNISICECVTVFQSGRLSVFDAQGQRVYITECVFIKVSVWRLVWVWKAKFVFTFPFAETLADSWQHVESSAGGGHGNTETSGQMSLQCKLSIIIELKMMLCMLCLYLYVCVCVVCHHASLHIWCKHIPTAVIPWVSRFHVTNAFISGHPHSLWV